MVTLNDDVQLKHHGLEKGVKYFVRNSGAYTECINGTGTSAGTIAFGGVDNVGVIDGTDQMAVLNAALANVSGTAVETVKVIGSYTVDAGIDVSGYTILDLYNATLTAGVSLDDDLITMNGWHNWILGGHLEGNSANNASGSGIRIGGTAETQRFFVGGDMVLHDFKEHGIHVEGAAGKLVGVGSFRGIDIENCGTHGFFGTTYGADCYIGGIDCGGNGGAGILISSGFNGNNLVGCKSWNNGTYGIMLDASDANNITGCRSDYNAYDGIVVTEGSNLNSISGNVLFNNSYGTPNTYSGIVINDSIKNIVTGNVCTRAGVATDQLYGIVEKNDDSNPEASDLNCIKGNFCSGNLYTANGYNIAVTNNSSYDKTICSATSLDLSGGAQFLVVYHATVDTYVVRAKLLYTEASSADAAVANDIQIGDETSNIYFFQGTSETNKAAWYTKSLTLLKRDLPAGESLTFSLNAGGKAGTGEIKLIVDLLENA